MKGDVFMAKGKFIKGMGIGLAVGATAAVAGKKAMENKKSISKKTTKAAKAVSSFAEGISTLMK